MRNFLLAVALIATAVVLSESARRFFGSEDSRQGPTESVDEHGNFLDGSFEQAGELSKKLQELKNEPPTGDALLDAVSRSLGARADKPLGTPTKGDVKLVYDDRNTSLELTATPGSSAQMTEFVLFDHRNVVIELDLRVLESVPGAVFQVGVATKEREGFDGNGILRDLFPETVLASYELSELEASNHLSVTGLKDYFIPKPHAPSSLESAHVFFRLTTASEGNARVHLDNLNVITLEELPADGGFMASLRHLIPSFENLTNAAADPASRQESFESFMQEISTIYEGIVRQLGPPPPEKTFDVGAEAHSDPRVERASRGFFQDMKAFFGERDSQDTDIEYQGERLRGMSGRIDQQFQDVSSLLREFEEKQYSGRETDLEKRARLERERRRSSQ